MHTILLLPGWSGSWRLLNTAVRNPSVHNSDNIFMSKCICSGPSGDASRLQTGPSADGTAHLPTFCPVCRRDRRQTGRPICKHFVPSANICDATTNLATFSTRDAATLGAGRIAQPFLQHLARSAVLLFAFCQVFSPSCKFLFLRSMMATRELFEQYCERFGGSKSKVINRQKGE